MNKKIKIIAGIAVAAVIILGGSYTVKANSYSDTFLPKTTIGGIDISDKTPQQANKALQKHFDNMSFKLTEKNKSLATFSGADLKLKADYTETLKKALNQQSKWGWLGATIGSKKQIDLSKLTVNQNAYDALFTKLTDQLNQNRKASSNAYLKVTTDDFIVEKEVYGNTFDLEPLKKQLLSDINDGKTTLALDKFYIKPSILSTDEKLVAAQKTLSTYANEKITYTVNGKSFEIPKTEIRKWLAYENDQPTVKEDAVQAYISSVANQYNTYDKARQFKSTLQGTVSVPAGIYGWSIRESDDAAAIVASVKEGKDFTHAALIRGSGYKTNGEDIGNTYIEVDLAHQKMWYYKDGVATISTDVVTGSPGRDTPRGVWAIWNKERNATLKGENYATPVDYWMPIDTTGVGLHDSPWQAAYGGDRYKTYGSHGCVNTPPAIMAQLFNAVEVGTPVIVL